MNKTILWGVVGVYLLAGVAIASAEWVEDLRTFDCTSEEPPHHSFTTNKDTFANHNPEQCVRRGFTWQSIFRIPTLTVLGVPLMIGQLYNDARSDSHQPNPSTETETTASSLVTELGDGWSRYTSEAWGFSIEFPSAHNERPFVEHITPDNYPDSYHIAFKEHSEDMGTFSVSVIPVGFAEVEAWFADRQENNDERSEYVLEQRVRIADTEALVTYWRETPENEQPPESRERRTALSRNGVIYTINTRGLSLADTTRIWESFRFIDADSVELASLIDGRTYYPGVYFAAESKDGLKSHHSEHFSLSLTYPNNYLLFENTPDGDPQAQSHFVAGSITIAPEIPTRQAIARAEAGNYGGAPPGIALTFYERRDTSTTLEQWLRTNPSGNFNPESDPNLEASLTESTVAGTPALRYYSNFGMYAADYVAFTYNNWFVLISAQEELARNDLDTVLAGLQLPPQQ